MTVAIQAAIKDMNMTTGDSITRRDALCELASIPLIAMGKTQTLKASRYEEMLRFCTAALEGCWDLYRGSDHDDAQHAFRCVSTYVPLLETIAHDSSDFRVQALDLAARYAMLQTMLGWSCIGARESIGYALNALGLSKESDNILLQLSAHSKVNWTYTQSGNCVEAHHTMLEGEHALKSYQRGGKGPALPSGMIGNFYSSYALSQTDNGLDPDRALGIATESVPLSEQIALVKFTTVDQAWEAARVCSAKGDPKQAVEWLEKLIDTNTFVARVNDLRVGERGRIGAINTLVDALLQLPERNMEHIIDAWSTATKGAMALKSEQRYRDAMANLAIMRTLWRGEQAVKKLMPLTSHW